MTGQGHNTKTTFAQGQLRSLVERIERLEEEKKTISSDVKEVYAEAKGSGFDVKIMRKVIALRKKEPNEREEEQTLLDLYMNALGMQPDLFDEQTDDDGADTVGERDGRAGRAPQPEHTWESATYMAGWHRGNKARIDAEAGRVVG